MKRVTLRDMANKLGLSHTAVSLALRGHASIPRETCDRVRALAKEMGYRPDPALSSLNAYRQANLPVKYQATLAWVNTFPVRDGFFRGRYYDEYVKGSLQRADELGYKVEEFWVPDLASWKRLPKTLRARRIEGLIVPPPPSQGVEGYRIFPWNDFFAIAVGTVFDLSLHLVINDQFQSGALAVRQMRALGYRRIGLVMPVGFARYTEFHFLGGHQSECARLKIPSITRVDESATEAAYQRETLAWIRKSRLDAIISTGPGDILPVLEKARLRVPEDIAVAFLARHTNYPDFASVDQNNWQIGVSAANHLVDLIRRNERGIPSLPMRYLIPGTWIDGASAPPIGAK